MDRDVGRLVGMAGARPPLPAERALRIRTAVTPAWLGAVKARRRRRLSILAGGALAAALAIVAGLALSGRQLPLGAQVLARAERVSGAPATVVAADGTTAELLPGHELRSGERIAAGPGRVGLRLAGGASLRIDAYSEVLLVREDLLSLGRGGLYLDSESESGREGIAVTTPFGTALEIGTRFEVRLEENALRVRVRDGRVRLSGAAATAEGVARDEMTLHPDGRIERGKIAVHGSEWSWVVDVAPAFALDRTPLGSFLEWAQREAGWSVLYEDAVTAARAPKIVIHGPAEALSPSDALPVVMAACDLSYRLERGVLTIGTLEGASP